MKRHAAATICGAKSCDRPVDGTVLCSDDTAFLLHHLATMPGLLDELETALTKQARFGGAGKHRKTTEAPMPYNPTAGDIATEARQTITKWQGLVADHYGQPVRHPDPHAAARWMFVEIARRQSALNTFVLAGQLVDALDHLKTRLERAVDRPAHLDRWYAGRCSILLDDDTECPQHLYAEPGTSIITCHRCGWHHDVAWRRDTLLRYADDVEVTATEAARAISVLTTYDGGERLLRQRISMWKNRERLEVRGHVAIGERQLPLYRLGDVLDLLFPLATQQLEEDEGDTPDTAPAEVAGE